MREAKRLRPRPVVDTVLCLTAAALLGSTSVAQEKSVERTRKTLPEASIGPKVVGTSVAYELEPRLDLAFLENSTGAHVWADAIAIPWATFVKAHLVDVNLRAGDVLQLLTPAGELVDEIRGRGPKDLGTFWALSAFGDELVLEFRFRATYDRPPFRIDQVILGDSSVIGIVQSPESVCGPENFDDAICYQADPGKWSNVMASVGVMSVGGNPATALFCSGSNVSPENYVLTNQHCITSQSSCDSSEFVFRFYRSGCNNNSPPTGNWQSFRCNDVVATKPIIDCDATLASLDYSLCSVIGDPAATFGYANPDPTPLTDGEAIYIIQHPAGRPHEIAHGSGANVDVDAPTLRYYNTLDTEGGSSGSPIFRESDDRMVGLHHCGGCESAGVGNRGMLMSAIHPDIEEFLCSPVVDLTVAEPGPFVQVAGDGDVVLEPGETWSFVPRVLNTACSGANAVNVQALVRPSAGMLGKINMLEGAVTFGTIAGGDGADALAPVVFRVRQRATCSSALSFDLVDLTATSAGPFADALGFKTATVGDEPLTTIRYDDFTSTAGWSIVNGGTGGGPASTWTTANPHPRSLALSSPFFIADSDELGSSLIMDEQLIGPTINCTGYTSVRLQFAHEFKWYLSGFDEQADVDVRSSATGGAWVNVANFEDGDASGTVTIDITAQAAGTTDLQVRFHYYDARFEWYWAIDDVFVLGTNGFECEVFGDPTVGGWTPASPGAPVGH